MSRRTVLVLLRRLGIVACLVVVLLRPGFGEVAAPTQVADIEVLVVVDRTRSMAALDQPDPDGGARGGPDAGPVPRIEGARRDLLDLAEALPGARYALLTYGFDVQLELPFTRDVGAFTAAVDTLRLEPPVGGIGSSVERPRAEMLEVLTRAEEQYPQRRRIVVFVSDGERTTQDAPKSMAEVGEHVDGGVVLGYGTEAGARMPAAADLGTEDGYVQDPATGEDAISRADTSELERLAGDLGVPFESRTPTRGGGADPDELADLVAGFEASYQVEPGDSGDGSGAGDDATVAHDLTWLAALALFALLLWELAWGWRATWSGLGASRAAATPRTTSRPTSRPTTGPEVRR